MNVPEGTLLIEFLGQAGFWLKGQNLSLLIDPCLSNYVVESGAGDAAYFTRQFPPPEDPSGIKGVDLIFVTHIHADHCDLLTLLPILEINPAAKVICPDDCARKLLEAGVESGRLVSKESGLWNSFNSAEYMVIPSGHYAREMDPVTGRDHFVGYIIRLNGVTLYHSGDTIMIPELIELLQKASADYDLVCLPVNGRDARRESMGIVGNLDGREALELTQILKAKVLLPMHNDLFAVNHIDPGVLASLADREAPRQRIHWLQPGEVYWYVK
jgi:L-ascorbate metabolism protein UlaG (beta-lactamase superfamily)